MRAICGLELRSQFLQASEKEYTEETRPFSRLENNDNRRKRNQHSSEARFYDFGRRHFGFGKIRKKLSEKNLEKAQAGTGKRQQRKFLHLIDWEVYFDSYPTRQSSLPRGHSTSDTILPSRGHGKWALGREGYMGV